MPRPNALPFVPRLLAPHPEPGQLLHQDILSVRSLAEGARQAGGWVPWAGDLVGIRRHPQEKPIRLQADFLTCGHIYSYHQRNGFTCILLEDVFQLG